MKKSFNYLLILAIICFALTIIINISSMAFNDFDFKFTNQVIDDVSNIKGSSGAGEYLLIAGTIGLFADFAMGFLILILLVLAPIFMQVAIIIFQGIARLFQIGERKDWKDIVSKIFTVISIITQALLCISFLFILISNADISKIILLISLGINIASLILFIREFIKMNKENNNKVENIPNKIIEQ